MNSYQRSITFALLIATFLSAIEVTIVATAMPQIVDSLGGVSLISWVFAAYLLTTAVMTPIFGKLADLFGRKKIFIFGVACFLAGSILCGFSQNMEQLIWFRAIQGIGAGALLPMTFTILGDIFSFEQRARIQWIFSTVWGVAGIFGPLAGGFITDFFSWHWIFFINVPFGLISIMLIWNFFKENIEKKERKIDYAGAITFMLGTAILLYALLSGGNEIAWHSVQMYMLCAIAFFLLALFILIQLKSRDPLLPIALFQNRNLATTNLSSFLISAILIGLTAYLPLWIQGVLLLGATSSGLTLIPMSLGWPLGANLSGRLMIRFGTRSISLIGVSVIFIGTAALAFITMNTPNWILVVIMFIVGLGFGLAMTVFTVVVQSSVDWSLRGTATSSNTFLRILGQTLGIAILGSVLNQQIGGAMQHEHIPPETLANGLHTVFILLAVIALLSILTTLGIPKQRPEQENAVG